MQKLMGLLLLFPLLCFAQEKKSQNKISFSAIGSAGIAGGETDVKAGYQLINGISWKNYSAGVGFGIDRYRFNSFPLFADMRMNFGKNRFAFIYTDLGYNFAGNIETESSFVAEKSNKYTGGLYADIGLGVKVFRIGKWNSILFSSGYSYKRIENTITYPGYCIWPPCNDEIYNYKYGLGRFTAKLSWQLGKL